MAQMATNMYKPKWPKLYKPKWPQICTSPNGPKCTSPNSLYINKFKPEASTELWEQQPSE